VTSFSTFAVVHPDALAGGFRLPLVPGGGKVATDCRAAGLPASNARFERSAGASAPTGW